MIKNNHIAYLLILIYSLVSNAYAQIDTSLFTLDVCGKYEDVKLGVEVYGRYYDVKKVSKTKFEHPLRIYKSDTSMVFIIQIDNRIYRLHNMYYYLEWNYSWNFCPPQNRKIKKRKVYNYKICDYGGFSVIGRLRYLKPGENKKMIFTDE